MFSFRRDTIAVSFLVFIIFSVISTSSVFAQEISNLNAGDTSWVLTSSAFVLGIHGIGGTWGALATGLFASVGGGTGLFFGNPGQVLIQSIGVGATWVFAGLGTFVILKIVDGVVGLRVSQEEEVLGLDLTQHSERAYG